MPTSVATTESGIFHLRPITTILLAMMAVGASAQTRDLGQSVSVKFAIDGKPALCDPLKIQLNLDGRSIEPQSIDGGFALPAAFDKKASAWSGEEKVDVTVRCGKDELTFSELHPTWVSPGSWEIGIVHPPYWFEEFRYSSAIEHGTWISYLVSECDGCDPGIVTSVSHSTPPASVVKLARVGQRSASGERARDLAYALAVYNVSYQQNRDYLLGLLNACLSRPLESAEDDVCDHRLLDYATNLYWRGDSALLPALLEVADSRKDVIGEIGTFYAQLLDRRAAVAVQALQSFPVAKQETICRLAGEDDLARAADHLHEIGGEVADRCLREAERAARGNAE
jgi:hypothetical protein